MPNQCKMHFPLKRIPSPKTADTSEPSEAKAACLLALCGTAEAVPFPKSFEMSVAYSAASGLSFARGPRRRTTK
jgi:hypothetical protein